MKRLAALALPALVLLPQAALAHPGHGEAAGLVHGFLHPVSGADHVLAMVAVGLLAALRGGRALWALPAAFLALMAAGAGLGMAGVEVSGLGHR
ncbi:MAG: urease accessory protein, partial [Methylobacterium sp.]